jgi:hypothetical protein
MIIYLCIIKTSLYSIVVLSVWYSKYNKREAVCQNNRCFIISISLTLILEEKGDKIWKKNSRIYKVLEIVSENKVIQKSKTPLKNVKNNSAWITNCFRQF